MSMDKPFRVEVTVDAPRDEVWRALTEPEQIRTGSAGSTTASTTRSQCIFVEHATLHPARPASSCPTTA